MIHVVAAIIATGAFAVGALALGAVPGQGPGGSAGARCARRLLAPAARDSALDRLAYRLHAFGFPLWTFAALVAGPIWAEYAWGRYWGWDPKEVWAFITWVVYAAYLHARATAGWKGKAAAFIALIGFATPAVQLRRDQLLLRRRQHALLRRPLTRPGPTSGLGAGRLLVRLVRVPPAVGASGRAGSPRRRRGRRRAGSGAAGAPARRGGASTTRRSRSQNVRRRRGPRTRRRRAETYPRPQGRPAQGPVRDRMSLAH